MKQENFLKAERLLKIRSEIDTVGFHTYTADDNHHGSNIKGFFNSNHLADAYRHLKEALNCIGRELEEL